MECHLWLKSGDWHYLNTSCIWTEENKSHTVCFGYTLFTRLLVCVCDVKQDSAIHSTWCSISSRGWSCHCCRCPLHLKVNCARLPLCMLPCVWTRTVTLKAKTITFKTKTVELMDDSCDEYEVTNHQLVGCWSSNMPVKVCCIENMNVMDNWLQTVDVVLVLRHKNKTIRMSPRPRLCTSWQTLNILSHDSASLMLYAKSRVI